MTDEPQALCLGRMPIISQDMEVHSYELLFVDVTHNNIQFPKDYKQSAKLVGSALNLKGLKHIAGGAKVFVSADKDFLLHDMVLSIPDNFVFHIHISTEFDERLKARLTLLREMGLGFSLMLDENGFENSKTIQAFTPYVDYLAVTMNTINTVGRTKAIAFLQTLSLPVVIKNVEKKYEVELFKDLKECYFQGYFFAQFEQVELSLEATQTYEVIDLCNLLSTQTSNKVISEAFLKAPQISVQLIQYINSSAFILKKHISSIEQLLALLGREKLRNWLLLTLYSSMKKNSDITPLMSMLDNRLELLKELHGVVSPNDGIKQKDQVTFLGLLSLIDLIIQRPMEEILQRLSVNDVIKEALLEKKNSLGELLAFAIAIEKFDLLEIQANVTKFGIHPQQIENLLAASIQNSKKTV